MLNWSKFHTNASECRELGALVTSRRQTLDQCCLHGRVSLFAPHTAWVWVPVLTFTAEKSKQTNTIKGLKHADKHAYHRENKLPALTNTNTKSTAFKAQANTISSNLSEEFRKRHRPQWMLDSTGFWECLLLFSPLKSFQFLDKHGDNLRTSTRVVQTWCCCLVCWAHSHLWKGDVYLLQQNICTSSEALGQPQYSCNLWLTAYARQWHLTGKMRVTLEDKHLLFKAQKLKEILLEKNCSYLLQNYWLAWVPHVGVSYTCLFQWMLWIIQT